MTLVVAMPWRPTPEREAAHRFAVQWWHRHYPLAHLVAVDTPHRPYNLSAVRNECVRTAAKLGADVVVIPDADAIIATPDSLQAAIADADDGRLHLPFDAQRYLTRTETDAVLAGGGASLRGASGNGAMYVCTPDTYWRAGGSDERFEGWGGDDDGLVASAITLTGITRHPGTVWSLWHADERRPVGTAEHRPNAELADRYWQAAGDPAAIEALIAERSDP